MARFPASSAFLRTGTIAGLAKAVAGPAYVQKVVAEPLIRRIVPFLIIIFLGATWTGVIIQLNNGRTEAIRKARVDMELISTLAALDLPIELGANRGAQSKNIHNSLLAALPPHALENDRRAYLVNAKGEVVAGTTTSTVGRSLDAILGVAQPLTALADRAGVMTMTLADGTEALATVRNLPAGLGQFAMIQPISNAVGPWRGRAISLGLLAAAATIVISALGIAFFQQSARAREADVICAEVRSRIDRVLNSGRSGLWDWDIPRGRIFWSDSMFSLLGRERQNEFLSLGDIRDWLHPDDSHLFKSADQLTARQQHIIDQEFRLRHNDGNWVWIRARGELTRDSETPHLVGIAVDVTEQKAQSEKQATADLRVRDAIETISEAFALFDAQQKLVIANTKYQRLLALPPEFARSGVSLTDILEQSDSANIAFENTISECEATGNRSYEMNLTDGRWFQVNERATKDGGHVSVSSDITAHKAYEESLAASNMVLEKTVEDLERSRGALQNQAITLAELAESHLEQKAQAESANRAKAEFLANMSHELRTPLNHIIGFAEMMETGIYGALGNDKYVEYVRDIGVSGRYLLEVISDILDMSSLEAGRVKLERKQVALAEIVQSTLVKLQDVAADRGIALEVETAGPLHVIGDRKAFCQIIGSLLGNAVKFTSEGGRAGLRAKRVGDTIQLFFEDNGGGISRDDLQKMGRPFEQNGAIIENGFKGSGLGFAIARSLAELHGGGIKVRSKLGVGTIVMLWLPVAGAQSLLPSARRKLH
jgi:two-component system, cell cycle sensor histidine kinase PleC